MKPNLAIPWENLSRRYSRYYIYLEPVVKDPLIRGYFSFVASVMLIAFFLVFALSPTINTILTLRKKVDEQRQLIANMDQKIANIVTAQENYTQIQSSLPTVQVALPVNPTAQSILAGISESASASGVTVTNLRFADIPLSRDTIKAASIQSTDPTGLPTLEFSFTVSGTTQTVRGFLKQVENLARQIHIKSLAVGSTDPSLKETATVTAVSYYLPGEEI